MYTGYKSYSNREIHFIYGIAYCASVLTRGMCGDVLRSPGKTVFEEVSAPDVEFHQTLHSVIPTFSEKLVVTVLDLVHITQQVVLLCKLEISVKKWRSNWKP